MKIQITSVVALVILILIMTGIPSCTHDPSGLEDLDTVCFDTEILPILQTSCGISGCHDGSGEEIRINDYHSVREIVIPGDPRGSELYRVITSINGENLMPPEQPLSQVQRTLIQIWIAQGANNTVCGSGGEDTDVCDTSGTVSFSAQVFPILQSNCIGCHNNSFANGGVNLSTYNQIKTYAETLRNGTPVIQGAIRRLAGFEAMPQAFALDECSIRKIEVWIAQGVQDN